MEFIFFVIYIKISFWFYHEHLSLQPKAENLMKACLCLYVDKIWFKVVYMLYFSFQKLEICKKNGNQKTQYLNNISTTFTTIF